MEIADFVLGVARIVLCDVFLASFFLCTWNQTFFFAFGRDNSPAAKARRKNEATPEERSAMRTVAHTPVPVHEEEEGKRHPKGSNKVANEGPNEATQEGANEGPNEATHEEPNEGANEGANEATHKGPTFLASDSRPKHPHGEYENVRLAISGNSAIGVSEGETL